MLQMKRDPKGRQLHRLRFTCVDLMQGEVSPPQIVIPRNEHRQIPVQQITDGCQLKGLKTLLV